MTVQSSVTRADATGNGVTTAFTVPFYFLDSTHIQIIRTQISTGVATTLALTTDYTVTGAGVPAGGTATMVAAPTADQRISILRNVPFTQLSHYVPNDPFPAATHEQIVDQLTMETQQLSEAVGRALLLPANTTGVSAALPAPVAATLIGWDSTATKLIDVPVASLGTAIVANTWLVDKFNGTGAQTVFTLTANPGNTNAVLCSVSGVVQVPGVNFSVTGTTLTFLTGAPASGTGNVVVQYGQSVSSLSNADASALTYTTPAGVATTVKKALDEGVTSARYGVKGDGVTDDTAALQAFFNAVTSGGLNGYLLTGNFKITSPVTISVGTLGFNIRGPGCNSAIITVASTFSGGTSALSLVGSANPVAWDVGGFSVQGTYGATGTAVTGISIGNAAASTIGLFGYTSSTLRDVFCSGFVTQMNIAHARMIYFINVGLWGNNTAGQSCLTLAQNGSFTGDLVFERCQFVGHNTGTNYCVNIQSPVGPYNVSTGAYSLCGVKFKTCDFYTGSNCINIVASAGSYVADLWFIDGCQTDGQTVNDFFVQSNNATTVVEDIHISHMYFNKATTAAAAFSCTGTVGQIRSIWIDSCEFGQPQAIGITFYTPTVGTMYDLHVNNNTAVDAACTGGVIEFNNCTNFEAIGNGVRMGYSGVKPNYLLQLDAGCTNFTVLGNIGGANVNTALILDNSGNVAKIIDKNVGFNPRPSAAITVTASPFTYTNTSGAPQTVAVGGGTLSQLTVNGSFVTPAVNAVYPLGSGQSMVVTYSVAPTLSAWGV